MLRYRRVPRECLGESIREEKEGARRDGVKPPGAVPPWITFGRGLRLGRICQAQGIEAKALEGRLPFDGENIEHQLSGRRMGTPE
jgi:hypothetical protein